MADPVESDAADKTLPRPPRSVPAGMVLATIVVAFVGSLVWFGSSGSGNPPRQDAAFTTQSSGAATPASPAKVLAPPGRNVPLRPPPNDAKVGVWKGKQIGFASIIVDAGNRATNLPKRAWVIAVATALQESALKNQGTKAYPVTERFPYDKLGDDYDSVGLFQQRPSQGWGDPDKLMDPWFAAAKFYERLAERVKNWDNWQDPSKVRLTDIAQSVQKSKYGDAYQKHEQDAIKIVDLVLQYQYTPEYHKSVQKNEDDARIQNNWFVMVQCQKPNALACRSMPWQVTQPVADNHAAFKAAFPKAELNSHLGDWRHENDDEPQDHTPIGKSCLNKVCNVKGWVYAQDFGNGKARDTGFDLNHFVHWVIDECRAKSKSCEGLKYVVTTIPSNKGSLYYGAISVRTGWSVAEPHDPDHEDHVHLSWQPGFERTASSLMANYVASLKSGGSR